MQPRGKRAVSHTLHSVFPVQGRLPCMTLNSSFIFSYCLHLFILCSYGEMDS